MTRLYLDTEFNGFGGDLISMAFVSPEGHHWYGVRAGCNITDPWVLQNVGPKLWLGRSGGSMSDAEFLAALHGFLRQFDNPEIICDWHADVMLFCQWLQGASYETSLDYACRITVLKTPPGQPVSKIPHNALADAQALMRWHESQQVPA